MKKIIENYMEEVWNKKNFEVVKEVFSEEAMIHSPLGQFKSPKEMVETIRKWTVAIPDIHISFLHTVEENGLVISHWEAKGTHQKELNGVKASGKPVIYQGVTMYRFDNEKVVEYWAYLDSWTLEHQMKS